MYSRLLHLPLQESRSFFLFGPRGTGKTSWIKNQIHGAIYLDLLKSETYLLLQADPGRLENLIPPKFSGLIVLDEVQKIPALLNEVHRLIESFNYKFVLTGSSARALRKKGVNLLAGRANTYSMYPLTVQELKEDFNLEKSLQYGHLPSVFSRTNPYMYLKSYVKTYLQEEVRQEGLTRNISNFSRFLEIISFSQGGVLNITEIAREVSINRKVVESYFHILEDLLLAFSLPVFTKHAKRRMLVHPKFYFFDVGVYRAIRPKGPLDSVEEIEGVALETLFIQEIRAINEYYQLGYENYYWRTNSGLEVDVVLYGERGILAFEIKRSKSIKGKDLSSLKEFNSDYPQAKCYFLYGGENREYYEGIEVIPFIEALKGLPKLLGVNLTL
ncbi:MAG: ATP-binding protein [Gammaproteobacteria bacterium]|jgi:predicted AAA+ superfamily ATPase